MANTEDPIVEQWYQQVDKDTQFRVTNVDDAAGLVEIQYLDGETEEIDLEEWYEMDMETIDQPAEWAGDEEEDDWDEEEEEEDFDEDEDEDESLDDLEEDRDDREDWNE